MTDPHDQLSPLEKFAAVNSLLLNATGEKCLDYDYDTFINSMREIEFNSTQGAGGKPLRSVYYLLCTAISYVNYISR